MLIRKMEEQDITVVHEMLTQIGQLHCGARPDIFRQNLCKYTISDLNDILNDDDKPVFVATFDGEVVGYTFCQKIIHKKHKTFVDKKYIYIDDFFVTQNLRGKKIGKSLFEFVVNFAKKEGFSGVELNVWEFNQNAIKFYEYCGFKTQSRHMEIDI